MLLTDFYFFILLKRTIKNLIKKVFRYDDKTTDVTFRTSIKELRIRVCLDE